MKKILLFITFDSMYRFFRLEQFWCQSESYKFYIYINPSEAQNEWIYNTLNNNSFDINITESDNLKNFDYYYIDLTRRDLEHWGKKLIKNLNSFTYSIQFLDELDIELFLGDKIIVSGFYSKMDINRQIHKLVRFGIIRSTEEIDKTNFHYFGEKKIDIFIGNSFLPYDKSKPDFKFEESNIFFYNLMPKGFENEMLKIFTEFSQNDKIKEISVVESVLMNKKNSRKFAGFVSFLKASGKKITLLSQWNYYKRIFNEKKLIPTLILSENRLLNPVLNCIPVFLVDSQFWVNYPNKERIKNLYGSSYFDSNDFNYFLSDIRNLNDCDIINYKSYFPKIIGY